MMIPVKDKENISITSKLAFEIWKEHYYPVLGKGQIDYMLDKFQSPEAISEQISQKDYMYYLLRNENENIGYIAFQPQENELFLSKFYIKKEHRKKGYGRKALNFIKEQTKMLNKAKIYLTVNKYNTDSMKIYEKLGFIHSGPIVQDIGNGYIMDDYKYELNI
jgi:diamine N-acetyltransferase